MEKFDWNAIDIDDLDDEDNINERLKTIHDAVIKSEKVDKYNSPGFEPTTAQSKTVSIMTGLGMSPKEISDILVIEESLLKMYYNRELSGASPYVNLAVAKVALRMALSGQSADMTKFWLKSRAGWRETSNVELTGKDGGPLELSTAKSVLLGGEA